ncbi:MAG: hypothetical protein GEU81_09180, partial [Nitriliruptorales bacterium]|nr:hypothetical protein [Nitriliruptorales bacterium]
MSVRLSAIVHRTHPPSTRRSMLLVGGGVLAISIAAFFRVPLLPMIGIDLGMSATQLGLVTTG